MLLRSPTAPCRLLGLLFAALLLLASPHSARAAGLSPQEALKRFQVAEGFEVKLFASEPQIRQPVAMQFDRRGRMWVVQYLQYPNPAGLKVVEVDRYLRTVYDRVPEPPPKGPRGVDRITILEDTDGDGQADKFKDFIEGLNLTTGLALGHGGAFVLQSPYLLFYADRNADDVPDGDPEVLLSGFGMEDSHAFANSLQWGPDGWLYGTQGSTVTANIRGITFQQGIWRYHPISKKFELFAEGGGNTWGLDFDRHGNAFAGTNYGNHAMLHQVQGAYYVKNFGKHGALQNPYAFGYFEHVPHANFKGGHVTIGGVVYRGGAFPEKFRDQYVAANVLSNAIYWHTIEPKGSSFANRFGGDLLTTDDQWFRPVDCTVGPEGSLYIADWYDQRANHVDPRDDWDKSNGRIYTLVAKGTPPAGEVNVQKLAGGELLTLLTHKNDWYSRMARLTLAERRDASQHGQLTEWLFDSSDPQRALEALWSLYVSGGWNESLAEKLLAHQDEHLRAWTVRLLGDEGQVSPAIFEKLVSLAQSDKSLVVRSQLACTAKRLPGKQCLPIVSAMVLSSSDVNKDPHIPLLLWWAIEDKAQSDRDAVLSFLATPSAWEAPLTRPYLVERLARRYASGGAKADFEACARLLSLAPSAGDEQLLIRGMEKGLEGQRLAEVPSPMIKPLARLWEKQQGRPMPDRELIQVSIRLGSRDAYARALKIMADRKAAAADRLAMIELQGQVGQPEGVPVLLALLDDKEPAAIRKAAMAGLARFSDPQIAQRVIEIYPKLSGDLKGPAKTLLCSRQPWAAALLAEVDGGRIDPKEIQPELLQQIALHNSDELNKLIEKHWGKVEQATPAEKRARMHGINVSLRLAPGDATRGKELFTKNCGICHTLFGQGNKVGPDLTGADRKNNEFLLSNIVDPSAVIRKEYFTYVVQMSDGRVLTGLIAESTPTTVTLLDAKNQRTVLAEDEIEEMGRSPLSIMPEKILEQLNAQQVRDLFAYLRNDVK